MNLTRHTLTLFVVSLLPVFAAGAEKTNVILVMADDIGYECYGAYGGTSYKTPVLDKMAKAGMRFDHAYQPGTVPAGNVSDDLVEFTDFMPTIANATGASPLFPTDGQSFLPQLHGEKGKPRETVFVYYWPRPEKGEPLRFVRNKRWKLYGDGRLIDVQNDVLEKTPIKSPEVDAIRQKLQAAMNRMPSEGQTLLDFD